MTGFDIARGAKAILITTSLAATCLMAAGCTPELASWSQAQSVQASDVKPVVLSHPVRFAPGSATVTAEESRNLSAFLASTASGADPQVALIVPPGPADGVSGQRRAAIETLLREQDIAAYAASSGSALAGKNEITVRVGRYVASRQPCPDLNETAGDAFTDTPPDSFGCATTTNITLMVANPRDLIAGVPAGGADANYAARGVELYRAGVISKSVAAAGSGSSQSGASGQGASGSPGGTGGN